jgi:AcrR family transcriptional regulator
MSELTTKNRILDTAEQLFSSQGFAATSLRAIIKEADVNTAAVHYHFGSKEGLIEAVLRRQAEPINTIRMKALDEVEAAHPEGPLPLEAVIEAFLSPAIQIHFKSSKRGRRMPQLAARAISEPDEKVRNIILSIFSDAFSRYAGAFMRALPHLSREEVMWRMHFMIGAMVFSVTVPRLHEKECAFAGSDSKHMMERLIAFIAGGMRVPSEKTVAKDHS